MSRDYKVRTEFLKLIEFEVLILEIPEVDIEDKLAYLAREKGKISKSLFEDFVIATCVANVNQLLYLINQHVADKKKFDLLAIRDELMAAIITINPTLNPDGLVINRNYVIKIKTTDDNEDERALTGNNNWDISYYDEIDALYSNYTKPGEEGKAPPPPVEGEEAEIVVTEDAVDEGSSEQKPIEDLEYEKVQKWWKRIGQYIVIKKFSPKDAESILKARFFHNRTSFSTFVVSSCVDNFESLFELLDNMGLPNRVAAPILMHELYELCRSCNEFLTFENAQVLSPDGGMGEEPGDDVGRGMQRSSRPDGTMGSYVKKKPKKRFKDVSKEDLLNLGDNMKVFLVGQNEAVDTMSEAIQRASVGLKDPSRPIGSFLFAGRTGVGKCVKQGSLVFSEQGIKPVESFCGGKKIEELEVGVYGIDGVNKTSHIYKEGVKPGRNIVTDNGYELGGSLIHPIIVMDGSGNMVFKKFNELTTDDYVAIQYNQRYFSKVNKELSFNFTEKPHGHNTVKHKIPTRMSTDFAYYIGLLTGDGSLSTDCVIGFTNKDKQLVKSFFDLSESLFGVTPEPSSDVYGYQFNSRYVYDFLKYGCSIDMVKSTSKQIPSSILESKEECIIAFIQGLMDTDGYFEENSGCVGITLSTKKLINQLQTVLLNFGIVSSVRYRLIKYNGGFNPAWELKIFSKFTKKFFNVINFRLNYKRDKYNLINKKNYNPNKDVIPNIHNKLSKIVKLYKLNRKFHKDNRGYYKGYRKPSRKKLDAILNSITNIVGDKVKDNDDFIYLKTLVKENIFWNKIASIAEDSGMNLYDFTVPETHTFTSNGFISHNTLATKVLADELIKSRDNIITIDCSEFSADHEYSKLIGAPSGYVGHENGGMLTNAVAKTPFSVVVFDEVEKASQKVHELLLQILDEGRLTDGKGVTVSFKDAVVVMTSNVGVDEVEAIRKTIGFGDASILTDDKKDKAIENALKNKFKPEFLNRIDSIVNFKTLIKEDYMKIIDIELHRLNENLKNNETEYKNMYLEFDDTVREFIYKEGIDDEYGARPLKRCIEKKISTPLAHKLLSEKTEDKSTVKVNIEKDEVDFVVEKRFDEPPFYITEQYQQAAGGGEIV